MKRKVNIFTGMIMNAFIAVTTRPKFTALGVRGMAEWIILLAGAWIVAFLMMREGGD